MPHLKNSFCGALCAAVLLAGCAHSDAMVKSDTSATAAKVSDAATVFDIKTLSCWDTLTVAEEDLNMAMMLVYGYSQGTKGQSQQSSDSIEAAFSKAFTFCENNPDALTVNAF